MLSTLNSQLPAKFCGWAGLKAGHFLIHSLPLKQNTMTQIIINYTDPITGDEASNIFDAFEDAYDFVCDPVNWPVTSVEVNSDNSAECGFYTAEEFVDYFNE
jgi:hypothetical protein